MAYNRITVRIPNHLGTLLRRRSRAQGQTPSELVRVALESYLGRANGARSAFDLAREAGVIGCVYGVPKDLSTNRHHLEGFAKAK
jgi:metal-responsive CopG/Arc/MetJ family transcriptional regulator